MADITTCMPLTPGSIRRAHEKIQTHVHQTPVLTSRTLNRIASTARDGQPAPRLNLYFKCENLQRIGAFKARGAFHAVSHLIEVMGLEEVRERGVVTHSSGNHAQALALAASTFSIPSYIVMPSISTPSKIAGTQAYTENVIFSGSTSQEREAKVEEVIQKTRAILVPPYDHPDIMLGQGTAALELHYQHHELKSKEVKQDSNNTSSNLRAVLTPCGGGGLLSGTTIYFSDKPETYVFGAEPSYEGANDGQKGLTANPPERITTVKSLTIADGLRTPLGVHPWDIFTSGSSAKPKFIEGIYSVTEDQIKETMRLVMERMKLFVEPSGVVALAVVLYDEGFRRWVYDRQQQEGGGVWDIGIVFSGGNTSIEAVLGLFGGTKAEKSVKREEGVIGMDGRAEAENVAG